MATLDFFSLFRLIDGRARVGPARDPKSEKTCVAEAPAVEEEFHRQLHVSALSRVSIEAWSATLLPTDSRSRDEKLEVVHVQP